jgi:delta-aminolevulinic acid dehydratase/porphobilinogen synthase
LSDAKTNFLQSKSTIKIEILVPRRLRLNPALRRMVRETTLAPDDFIYPLFVTHGQRVRNEIGSMPGVHQWSIDLLARDVESIAKLQMPAVILFSLPRRKIPSGWRISPPTASCSKRSVKSNAPCRS